MRGSNTRPTDGRGIRCSTTCGGSTSSNGAANPSERATCGCCASTRPGPTGRPCARSRSIPCAPNGSGFRVEAADAERALYAFDRDPGTSFRSDGRLAFEVPDGVREYVLLLDLPGEDGLRVRQLAADGSVLSETAVGEPFFRLALADGAASVALEGPAEVFEIIAR